MRGITRLIHEIHRRGLWQAGAAFLGAAWAVLEVMDLFTGRGLLPDWTFTGALVVLGLGFPVVLATAFVQTAAEDAPPGSGGPPPEQVDGGKPPIPSGEALQEGSPNSLRALLTWRRAFLGGAMAFGALAIALLAFGVMRVTGIGAPATLMAQGFIEEGGLVVLADFESTAGSSAPSDLVTEALRIDLEQSPTFEVLDPRAVAAGLARMVREPEAPFSEEVALELAVREGAEAVVSGEVGSVGGGYILAARILSARDGALLAAFRETARDSTRLIDAIDALSASIRSKMGEALRSVAASDPLSEATTGSLEALRKFTFVAQREPRGAISGVRARQIIEEAVALDTTFADAYRYLSILINNYGGSIQQGVTAATMAFQYRDRLPARKRLLAEANYHMRVTGDYPQAARAYRGLLELDSLDAVAATNLADVVMYEGDYGEAEGLLLLNPRPETIPWTWNMMVSLAGQQKYVEAEASLDRFAEALPDNAYLAPTRALFFATRGRTEEALAALEAGAPFQDDVAAWAKYVEAVALAQAGRLDEARRQLARMDELLTDFGTPAERSFWGGATAFLTGWVGGDTRKALQELEALDARVLEEDLEPVDRSYGVRALLYALNGAGNGARELLDRYESEVPAEGDPDGRANAAVAGALVRILEGASVEASGLETVVNSIRCARCRELYLGHAYELAGDTPAAVEAYEAYVEDGFFDASLYVLHLPEPVVHERLGVLYEALGDQGRALEHYREFAARWAGADTELQPRVERARERITDLGG